MDRFESPLRRRNGAPGVCRRSVSTPRRRDFLSLVAFLAAAPGALSAAPPTVEVWKATTCGCCREWIAKLMAGGFDVRVFDIGNVAVRKGLGMPARLGSCHTARVGGYVLEGHVPLREVRRLLAERPTALGLAVPGMPIGSEGMDGAVYGGRRDPYDVLLVQRDGSSTVYASYR
jgi:hypothetical protein